MRRTKIVVTLGPASSRPEIVGQLIRAGMDVARLNFSHGERADHEAMIQTVREQARQAGRVVGILQDLQGPKIRTGSLKSDGEVELVPGQPLEITTEPVEGTARQVSTTYKALPQDVRPGDRLLISDGVIELTVQQVTDRSVVAEVVHGGPLRPHQGINMPGVRTSASALTDKDLDDLQFGLARDVDYIAMSFVRRSEDITQLKGLIAEAGKDVPVIAKLEKRESLENLEEILSVSDGVMVARGDMGLEFPLEQVPLLQKDIIHAANRAGIPVITATQMLESMLHNPRPTRAEVSDVVNAILDGSDAVMLSGETAIGEYPVETVRTIARIAEAADRKREESLRQDVPSWMFAEVGSMPQAIGSAVSAIVRSLPVRAICVLTKTGSSARHVSHYRPNVPILAFTPEPKTMARLSLYWGVLPVATTFAPTEEEYYHQIQSVLMHDGLTQEGDTVVVTGGHPIARGGPTNFLKIMVLSPGHPTMGF